MRAGPKSRFANCSGLDWSGLAGRLVTLLLLQNGSCARGLIGDAFNALRETRQQYERVNHGEDQNGVQHK